MAARAAAAHGRRDKNTKERQRRWAAAPLAKRGIFTLQGARSAIRNLLKTCQCCNPLQSAICHAEHAKPLQALGAGT
eukprot:6126613-Alexandrium_andersonii.AAC.1